MILMKISKTPAKIIISGEHSVVYGNAAIALPFLKLYTETKIVSSRDFYFFINGEKYLLKKIVDKYLGYKLLIKYFIEKFKIKLPFIISVKTNIPHANGLGQSASIAISIARSLLKYHKVQYSDELLLELSYISENYYHKNPSGIDQMVLIKNTNIVYQNGKVTKYLNNLGKGYLLICNTQIDSKTIDTVEYIETNERHFNNTIDEISKVTNNIIEAWSKRDLDLMGNLMHKNQKLL